MNNYKYKLSRILKDEDSISKVWAENNETTETTEIISEWNKKQNCLDR